MRPTQDRVREALFSILGERVQGSCFLDLCAGSGAVGVEAWSRGAASVCWVESDRRVFGVLKRNVETLCPGRGQAVLSDAVCFLGRGCREASFSLVYVDPPYAKGRTGRAASRAAMLEAVFERLAGAGMLAGGGRVILEQGADERVQERPGWGLVGDRTYGRTRLCFYDKEGD